MKEKSRKIVVQVENEVRIEKQARLMESSVGAYSGGGIFNIPGILVGKVRALYDIQLSPYIVVCTGSSLV
jgi:hypothetical protein